MWETTGWVFRTWLKVTIALGLGVLGVWLFTTQIGLFYLAVIAAGLIEVWASCALAREWVDDARYCWWWTRR